jgi:hypothetical protein
MKKKVVVIDKTKLLKPKGLSKTGFTINPGLGLIKK